MRTHHVAMDVNKDGVVSWDDFEQMIKRFNETGLLKDEQKQSFEEAVKVMSLRALRVWASLVLLRVPHASLYKKPLIYDEFQWII
jgi:hypothetical protein